MTDKKRLVRERPFYLIPIMMGMAGVLFSSQLEDTVLRAVVVLLALAVPFFVGGNVLARIHSTGFQRWLLMGGMFTLTLGAVVTISGLSESFVDSEYVSPEVGMLSRYMGMGSLLLGLLVVLYTLVRSEALIDELGHRFEHVADHMGEGFVLVDSGGVVVLANRGLTELTGIEYGDIIGRRIQDLARDNNVEQIVGHGERRKRGLSSEYEIAWNHDGEEKRYFVTESQLFDRRKKRVGTLLTLHDVTEEHRLKVRLESYAQGLQQLVENRTVKLRESERKFRDLLLTMNEGFITVEDDLTIRFANVRIAELLGVEPDQLRGRSLTDFVHSDDRVRLRAAIDAVGAKDAREEGREYLFVREDGGLAPVKVSIALLGGDVENYESSFSLVVTDVRELKAMQEKIAQHAAKLEEANEELRRLDRTKDIFLSNVSHELRTPLGTLDGYIDMLRSETLGAVEGPQMAALGVMSRNVDRLTSMINEMIESSRMEIRGIRLSQALFHGRSMVREAVESRRPQAMQKDISVTAMVSDTLPFQWGDREKLEQVLGILLSNAIKFTPEGGSVTVSADTDGDGIVYTVTDTGIGIDLADRDRVFKKFYQVDSSMTRRYQGTGIGLSIAKSIVESHGGRIALESTRGRGSTFHVFLPGAVFEAAGIDNDALSGRRIVLVNTFADSSEALCETLSKAGAEVSRYTSGYEGVRRARDEGPDAIIFDESLTDIPVLDALRRLEESSDSQTVPAITLWDRGTGGPSEEERHVSEISRVLLKPFTADMLIALVRESIEKSTEVGRAAVGNADRTG